MNKRLALLCSLVIPFSGYVILKKPIRGFIMLCWLYVFSFITFRLTTFSDPWTARYSGGIAIYLLSIVEIYRLQKNV